MKKLLLLVAVATLGFVSCSKDDPKSNYRYIDFSDLSLSKDNTNWDLNKEGINSFKSGIATFYHKGNFWGTSDAWYNSGCFYSNRTTYEFDETKYQAKSSSDEYQYTSAPKSGYGGSIYVVYNLLNNEKEGNYNIKFDAPIDLKSIHVTNNAYAYCSMNFGDGFGKKFNNEDWFKAIFTAYDENKKEIGKQEVFLAKDGNIIKEWEEKEFNFSKKISFLSIKFDSSDKSSYGISTPLYICIGEISYLD